MSEQQDTIALIGQELLNVVSPLKESFSDAERFKGFLYTLGWEANGLPNEYIELAASVTDAEIFIQKIAAGTFSASDIPGLIGAVKNLYDKILGISSAPPGVNASEFLSEIGERLFEFLLTSYLQRIRPVFYNLLSAMEVIHIQNIADSANKHAFIRTEFKWEEIPKILQDPLSIVKRVYGWGGPQLNSQILFEHMSGFLHGLGFPVMLTEINDSITLAYSGGNPSLSRSMRGIKIPFHYNVIGTTPVELSVNILELPATAGKLPGLVIQPGLPSVIPLDFDFGNEVSLHIKAGSDIANKFGVIIRPDEFSVKYPFQDGTSFPSAGFEVSFDYHPPEPKLIVGSPGGIRIQEKGFVLGFQVISVSGDFEIKFYIELKELSLVLAAYEGDGFLKTLLGDGETKVDIPLGIDWSSKNGFGFRGSGNFEIALNPHLTLGPITISGFQLSLGLPAGADPKIKLEAGININGDLGPLKAVVEEIGIGLYINFKPGNLGPLSLELGFKPPNGVGLSVDVGVVKGGGYLFFDFDKGEYAGALELTFSGIVSLKAIGIITTKMPDGSDGFSLLIIITAEFGTGIQLGFGFVLLGVGGLLGLNRTMRLQPLAEGVRTGGINDIMFPTDVVANAPRIISDLRNYFPPEEGKFLIGPMAKLAWGTPALITISLGIIIEIPGNIAILGVLKVALPTADAPLIILQINFIGAIEFDKSRLWFFASLYDSRILFITLEGEMGLLVAWGNDANFVVSVGGFHPSFNPPPLPFGSIARLSLNILNEPFGRIRVMAYFAVTSNTVQFGAHAELFFGVSAFNIDGHIGFDALFQFSPFYFIIELSASLSVKVFGVGFFSVRVKMSLEGPTPYRAKGTGSISLFFFDIDVDFDFTWGESKNTTVPPIELMPLLKREFDKIENWKAQLPPGTNILVSLRKIDAAAELVLHPVGTLQVSQRYVPLDITLDKIGAQKPKDVKKFTLDPAGTSGLGKKSDVKESFAMAQFQEMTSANKLSRPSFEKEDGGLELSVSGQQVTTGKAVKRIVRYELIVIDTNFKRFARKFFDFISGVLFFHFLKGNAVANSPLSFKTKKQYQPFEEKVAVKQATYSVANVMNNKAYNAGAANFASEAQAREFIQQQAKADPNLKDNLHIILQHELNTAA